MSSAAGGGSSWDGMVSSLQVLAGEDGTGVIGLRSRRPNVPGAQAERPGRAVGLINDEVSPRERVGREGQVHDQELEIGTAPDRVEIGVFLHVSHVAIALRGRLTQQREGTRRVALA